MAQVTASAPAKLILFGEHAVVHGHPCIVTAVDQRITVTVKKNGIDVFHLDAPDLGMTAYSKTIDDLANKELPKAVRFVEHLYKRFLEQYPQKEGINVVTNSQFSSKFGFGSSSAVTVAFAKALTTLYEVKLSNKELFDLCYQAVIDVQGVGSGFDIAAAIWGGTIYYVKPAKIVEPFEIDHLPLLVGYTGIKADTPTLIRMVERQLKENPVKVKDIFNNIENLTIHAKEAILKKNWAKVGQLMTQNQRLLRELQVSSNELENLIQASVQSGAYGAKLSGAGGGDCMVTMVEPDNQAKVKSGIKTTHGTVIDVSLHAEGVRIEESS